MRKFTMMCPNCHSTHRVQKNNYARKAGATIGFTAGGIAGGLLGALTGATAGLCLGAKAGEVVDKNILNNYKCLCCEYEFSN